MLIKTSHWRLEIRSWSPKLLPMFNVALVQNDTRLMRGDSEDGRVVAIIDIVSCEPWIKKDCKHSGCNESEFEEGWLVWEWYNIRKLDNPVHAIAKCEFYDLTNSKIIAVKRELGI